MWTYKTIWNICISDFAVASLLLDSLKKKNLVLTSTKMCAIGQTNEYSNKLKIWENKTFDCQHGRWGCVSSILSSSHYRTVRCKTIRNSWSFSFMGFLSHVDKLHHRSGMCFKCRVCCPSPARPAVSRGDLWPPPSRLRRSDGLSQILWESFTRWMFKVAELCFVKCVFMLHHVVSSQCHNRVKILH